VETTVKVASELFW